MMICDLTLRLHVAAHHTERHPGLAVFRGKTGNDGLEGTLARRIDVGVAVLEREKFAAILEHEAEAVGDEAGAHAAEIGLDLADHHAGGVGDGEIGGVAVARRLAGIDRVRMASGLISLARSAAYDFEISQSIGILAKCGSA